MGKNKKHKKAEAEAREAKRLADEKATKRAAKKAKRKADKEKAKKAKEPKQAAPKALSRRYDAETLGAKTVGELRTIAGGFGIAGRSKLNKSDLINAIYESPENSAKVAGK